MTRRRARSLKRITPKRWTTQALSLALLTATTLPLASNAAAQSDPTSIGAGQRPYVMILMDSSASMEFTTEGDGFYPVEDNNNPTNDDSQARLDTWLPEKTLNGGNSNRYGESDGLELVGPCYVWEPKCDKYDRPAWYPGDDLDGSLSDKLHPESKNNSLLNGRISNMRGNANYNLLLSTLDPPSKSSTNNKFRRLKDSSQPKHVQLKEILTGDMILLPLIAGNKLTSSLLDPMSLDPKLYGPGCWFVPRMHGSKIGEDTSDLCYNSTNNNWDDNKKASFQKYVDFDDTRPHLQEVFDFQHRTGLMDNFASAAMFGVALFDGYPGRLNKGSGIVDHDQPNRPSWPNDGTTADLTSGRAQVVEENNQTYNLGVYKIVGPKTLWKISSSELPVVTEYTQLALVDAGYLRNKDVGDDKLWKIDPKKPSEHGFTPFSFSKLDEKLLPVYYSGQQAMGGGTPLAAAVYDIHNYMINGQAEFKEDGRPENYNALSDTDDGSGDDKKGYNPIQNDRYKMCRPKHLIVMTDGAPAPERPGGVNDLGVNFLNRGFGYDEALDLAAPGQPGLRYRYETAEWEIEDLRTDPMLNTTNNDPRYMPHVHIVGLTPLGTSVPAAQRQKIAHKLGAMAASGGTCAQYWLLKSPEGRAFIPSSWGSCDPDSPTDCGTCNDSDPNSNCLVDQLPAGQYPSGIDYRYPPPPIPPQAASPQIICRAPSLVLSKNDSCSASGGSCDDSAVNRTVRDDLTFALSIIFNQVLDASGGIASRTRPTITNRVDTAAIIGQHRIYSGVQINGGSRYWKGLLNRQNLVCRADDSAQFDDQGITNLHDEIALQVRDAGTRLEDNRRVFTSMKVIDAGQPGGIPTNNSNLTSVIFSDYQLRAVLPSQDDFDEYSPLSTMPLSGLWKNTSQLKGKRIPLTDYDLSYAAQGIAAPDDPGVNWQEILNVPNANEARALINLVRGRSYEKFGKTLSAILNSNPVVLEPPSRDLPIDSYRAYRELHENRPTMLFVSTLDGLLHGIYSGELNGPNGPSASAPVMKVVRRGYSHDNSGSDIPETNGVTNGSISQREAWAYAPELLRKQYALFDDRQPNLLDGGLVVRDVRLCHEKANLNQNQQACLAVDTGSNTLAPSEQWRSVLVAGLGQAGSGYFALDVTRTGMVDAGGEATAPDPIPLWELGPDWEKRQLEARQGIDFEERFSTGSATIPPPEWNSADRSCLSNANDVSELDAMSFMGLSTAEPEIATVILDVKPGQRVQRPVAIFSAGLSSVSSGNDTCLRDLRAGRAIYVVDLQTGTILRRFVSYFEGATQQRFEAPVSGSPTAYNNTPGTVASRAFAGDTWGRLFRIDMSSPDLTKWRVDLMFDPCDDDDLRTDIATKFASNAEITTGIGACDANRQIFGEAAFKPSIALGRDRNIVVTYGLGDRTDISTANKVQAVISLNERLADQGTSNFVNFTVDSNPTNTVLWRYILEEGEKLTGEPVIFNKGTYFTTYVENLAEPCEAGTSRIYGLDYEGDGSQGVRGFFNKAQLGFTGCPNTGVNDVLCGQDPNNPELALWTGPEQPSLIRGLTITLGPTCSLDYGDPANQKFNEKADAQPTLLATMGGSTPPNNGFGEGNPDPLASNDLLSRFKVQLQPPRSQLMPLSFVSLGQ